MPHLHASAPGMGMTGTACSCGPPCTLFVCSLYQSDDVCTLQLGLAFAITSTSCCVCAVSLYNQHETAASAGTLTEAAALAATLNCGHACRRSQLGATLPNRPPARH